MINIVDYPANPTVGQEHTVGTTTKIWDGEKWANKSTGQHERRIGELEKENRKVSNVQELKSIVIDESWVGETIEVLEYHEGTGYGAGRWKIKTGLVANGTNIVQSLANTDVQYQLIENTFGVYPEQLGVLRNDSSSFSRLNDYEGRLIFAPETTYLIDNHDIDVSTQIWIGNGATLDGSGIANVTGAYAVRFKNTGQRLVSNISYISNGENFGGFTILGASNTSNVIGMNFDSSEAGELGLGGLNIGACTVASFGIGHRYFTNAYIITHYGANILRCGTHIYMPSGGTNYGENIKYVGGVISTSSGLGIHNVNANGNILLYGVSLDYMGKIAYAERGGIYIEGGHIEFDNGTNALQDIPFEVGSSQDCHLSITNVSRFLSYSGFTQSHVFKHAGDGSIYVSNCFLQKLVTSSGFLDTGDGDFIIKDTKTVEGSGNIGISTRTTNNLMTDGSFELANAPDAYIKSDTQPISDRLTGANIALTLDSDSYTGTQSLKATKSFGNGSVSQFAIAVPVERFQQVGWQFFAKVVAGSGTTAVTSRFISIQYYESWGQPITKKTELLASATRIIDNADTDWTSFGLQLAKNKVPSWATHIEILFNMNTAVNMELLIDSVNISTI